MSSIADMERTFDIGDFSIRLVAEDLRVNDWTPGGQLEDGLADEYDVRGRGHQRFTVRDVRWANGERDVRIVDRHSSPKKFDDVIGRLRLTVDEADEGELRVDLRVPKVRDGNRRATLHQTDEADLRAASGLDVRETLERFGCRKVGTREQLLGDGSTRRNSLCAVFPAESRQVPVAALVLTRLATLA